MKFAHFCSAHSPELLQSGSGTIANNKLLLDFLACHRLVVIVHACHSYCGWMCQYSAAKDALNVRVPEVLAKPCCTLPIVLPDLGSTSIRISANSPIPSIFLRIVSKTGHFLPPSSPQVVLALQINIVSLSRLKVICRIVHGLQCW